MLKMSGFDVFFAAAGNFYLLMIFAGIGVALWKGKTLTRKVIYAALVLMLSVAPIAPEVYRTIQSQAKLAQAQELFDERCKTAGQKIYRSVDGVSGVLLMRVRQHDPAKADPNMPGAAAAHEFYGDGYIRSFLLYEREPASINGRSLSQDLTITRLPGYKYVEVMDSIANKRYRYTLTADMQLHREEAAGSPPQYGITFEDIVDPSDRKYWIAGSRVKVIDLRSQETLGEFTRYVIEPGQGSQSGQRSPWLFARGCNMKASYGSYSPRLFADQILKPTKESM